MPVQPSNSWSLQPVNPDGSIAGAAVTLASLGIESAVGDENDMAAEVMTFTVGGKAIDATPLWTYGQLLALLNPSGVRKFFGRIEPWSREGTPDKQNHIGRLVNPWWYLAQETYQQRYNIPQFDLKENITGYTQYSTPRVILYILYNGVPGVPNQSPFYAATTGQQIADAINWAIAQGAPIKLGQMDPATTPFSHFQKGIKCDQVIKHAFKFEPDFKLVWDYTTVPFPTLHCLKQASMVALVIDLTTPGVREKITIKERPDWQRSYVAIHYDALATIAGQQYISLFNDIYPNPLVAPAGMSQTEFNFRGVDLFCDLSGARVSVQNQQANFASKAFDITSLATWTNWKPHLSPVYDPTITSVTIIGANTVPAANAMQPEPKLVTLDELDGNGNPIQLDATCTYEIVDGAWADWIPGSNAQRVRASAFAYVVHKAAPGKNPRTEYVPLSHDLTAVNINTGGISQSFTQQTTQLGYAEPAPVGLAQQMLTSWKNLAIEGSFQNVEAVIGVTQPISGKNCLNFKTPNEPAWAAVNAIIRRISWDIANGVTHVEFGAPLLLTGNELIDAIRATRFRLTTVDMAYVFGGALPGAGTTRMSRKHHAQHSQAGSARKMIEQISAAADPSNPPTPDKAGVITLDPTVNVPDPKNPPTGPIIGITAQKLLDISARNPQGT